MPVPFLTIYLGGQLLPPVKGFARPVKSFLPPKCEAVLLTVAVRIAVDLLVMRLCPSIVSTQIFRINDRLLDFIEILSNNR